jgi:hypothetical protein
VSTSGAGTGRLWWVINAAILLVSFIALTSCSAVVPVNALTPIDASTPDNKIISISIYSNKDNNLQSILKGAIVRVHGTNLWDNDDYEGYYLDTCIDTQYIVATAPGYTIEAVPCHTGTINYIIILSPLASNNNSSYSWKSARSGMPDCSSCHSDNRERNEYFEWENDGHSTVFSDGYFWTMFTGMNVNGNPGKQTTWRIISTGQSLREKNDSIYGSGYLLDYPNEQGNCAYCHAPTTVQGTRQQYDLENLIGSFARSSMDVSTEGITCDICHKVTGVVLGDDMHPYSDRPGILSLSFAFPDPAKQLVLGPDNDVLPPSDPEIDMACASVFSESKFCAACHYGKFLDTVIYNSYGEWLDSGYSKKEVSPDGVEKKENPDYRSCQDCHMLSNEAVNGTPISRRDACSYSSENFHDFDHNMMKYGVGKYNTFPNVPLLIEDAATLVVKNEYDSNTNSLRVITEVMNVKAGHKFPTDSPLRHLILVVEARDELGNLLPQFSGETIPLWGGVGNDKPSGMENYGGMPGKIYANLLADRDTNVSPTAAYWNPTKPVFVDGVNNKSSDTRLIPNVPDRSIFSFAVPSAGKVFITVKLVYRYAFIELAHQKGWTRPDVVVISAQCVVNPTQPVKSECP